MHNDVVYKGRALPLCWLVRKGKKGHFPEDLHIALVEQVQEMIPPGAKVVLLGDGEFDGTALQQTMEDAEWSYVCRTGCNLTATWDGDTFRLDTLGCCGLRWLVRAPCRCDGHAVQAYYWCLAVRQCVGMANDVLNRCIRKESLRQMLRQDKAADPHHRVRVPGKAAKERGRGTAGETRHGVVLAFFRRRIENRMTLGQTALPLTSGWRSCTVTVP